MSEPAKTETLSEEERKRIEYNSHIGENYRRIMTMDGAALRNEKTEERHYPSLDAFRPLHARKEITFEDVQIPEEIRRETELFASNASAPAAPAERRTAPAFEFRNSIYADPGYREAARRKEAAFRGETAATAPDEALAMPTPTTLQYGKATAQEAFWETDATLPAAAPAALPRVIATPAEDARAYYAALLKKVLVGFAAAFVVMMVVIAVNSAVLNGMNLEIAALQQTLDTLSQEVAALQEAVGQYTIAGPNGVPPAIWDFIVENGMILA